jgi:hypothetical protein
MLFVASLSSFEQEANAKVIAKAAIMVLNWNFIFCVFYLLMFIRILGLKNNFSNRLYVIMRINQLFVLAE